MKIKELKKYLEYANGNIDIMVLPMEKYQRLLTKAKAYDNIKNLIIDVNKCVYKNTRKSN